MIDAKELDRLKKICEEIEPGPWKITTAKQVGTLLEVILSREHISFLETARSAMPALIRQYEDALEIIKYLRNITTNDPGHGNEYAIVVHYKMEMEKYEKIIDELAKRTIPGDTDTRDAFIRICDEHGDLLMENKSLRAKLSAVTDSYEMQKQAYEMAKEAAEIYKQKLAIAKEALNKIADAGLDPIDIYHDDQYTGSAKACDFATYALAKINGDEK